MATKLNALLEPAQDGHRFGLGQDAHPNHKSGVVVNQPNEPGLDVATAGKVDEEGAFDVNVPQFIRCRSPNRRRLPIVNFRVAAPIYRRIYGKWSRPGSRRPRVQSGSRAHVGPSGVARKAHVQSVRPSASTTIPRRCYRLLLRKMRLITCPNPGDVSPRFRIQAPQLLEPRGSGSIESCLKKGGPHRCGLLWLLRRGKGP